MVELGKSSLNKLGNSFVPEMQEKEIEPSIQLLDPDTIYWDENREILF